MQFAASILTAFPLFAAGGGPSPSFQWGIVLMLAIIGIAVAVSPQRRTYEVKKPKED